MFAYRVYKYYCTCIYIDRTVENEVKAGKQIKVRFLTTGKDWDIKNVHLVKPSKNERGKNKHILFYRIIQKSAL